LQLRHDGVLQINTFANIEYTPKEVQVIIDAILVLVGDKKYHILIIPEEHSSITFDSLKLLAGSQAMSYSIAKAYVIKSLAQKIMANFYTTVFKPKQPVKFFNSQQDAEKWLLVIAKGETISI
jgi:hypothetical protein